MIIDITTGTFTSGERLVRVRPAVPSTAYPSIMVHGAEGDPNGASAWLGYGTRTRVPAGLLSARSTVYSPELAGNHTWGNPASQTRMDQAYAGIGSGKVILACQSMGGPTGLTWAANNPTKVAGIILVIPVLNLQSILSSSYAAELNSAYSGGYSDAVHGSHSPVNRIADLRNIPILMFYGDSDTLCLPQYSTQFGTGTGAQMKPIVGGHEERVVNLVDSAAITQFVRNLQ